MVTKPISQNVTVSAEDGSVRLLVNPDGSINVNTGGGTTADVNLAEVGGAAVTLGQKAMAASLPVAIASDQGALPTNVSQVAGNAVVTGGASGLLGVGGNVANGGTDAGNPVKIGGVYNTGMGPATTGQRVDASISRRGSVSIMPAMSPITGLDGRVNTSMGFPNSAADPVNEVGAVLLPVTAPYVFNATTWDRVRGNTTGTIVIPPQGWQYAAASGGITNTTAAVTIKASAGAGLRNYVSSVQINTDALGTATELAIRDGAAGTVLWRQKLQTTTALPVTTITFTNPLVGSVATLLEVVTLTATVTGAVFFNAQGYVAP